MIDLVHFASTGPRGERLVALLGRSLCRTIIARGTRRALDRLPDNVLRDLGLTRHDIAFVAEAVASGRGERP